MNTSHPAASSRQNEQPAPAPADRLIDYREVNRLIGSRCQTAHTARSLAARGQIKAVYLNSRVVRYVESSVLRLVAGLVDPVAAPSPESKGAAQ